jgi:hypothetical protein
MIGKLFGNILFTRILCEVSERWLVRYKQFGFRPKHSTALQLAHLVEIVSRNADEKRLPDAGFLDLAKTFDIVWVDCLLNKLTFLNFPSYLVKTNCSSLHGRTFEVSFQRAPSTCFMRTGVAEGGIMSPVQFSLYVDDMPSHSRQVELAPNADKMAILATSRQPAQLDNFLTYLRDLKRWLREWRKSINVSKRAAMLFAKAYRRIPTPRLVRLFG